MSFLIRIKPVYRAGNAHSGTCIDLALQLELLVHACRQCESVQCWPLEEQESALAVWHKQECAYGISVNRAPSTEIVEPFSAVCSEAANTDQGARAEGHILHGCSSVCCVTGVNAWHLVFTNSGGVLR